MSFWLCSGGSDFLPKRVESYLKDITYIDAGLPRFHLAVSASDLSQICGTVYLCVFSLIAEPKKLVQWLCLFSMLNLWNLPRVCIGLDPKKHHWHNLIDWLIDQFIPYFSFLSSSHSSSLHFSFTGLFLFFSVCLCLFLSWCVCLSVSFSNLFNKIHFILQCMKHFTKW